MLDKQTQEKLFKLSEELQGLMEYLYVRWQDEKDFEDIKDYSEPIKHILQKHEATFGKMTKKPFGFYFEFCEIGMQYKINSK